MNPLKHFISCLILFSVFLAFSSRAQTESRTYRTIKVEDGSLDIDGLINEPVWDKVEWSGDFVQREPYEYAEPSQQTAIKILYGNDNVYIAVRCFDTEPEKIEKRLSRRDSFEGDWVAIGIDSYNDKLTGFSFSVSAAGVKNDGIVTNENEFDDTWNPVWYVKVSTDAEGWVAEMKIPFTQLRFAKTEKHTWGLEVLRYIFRKQEMSLWQMISQEDSRWVSLWGELQGIEDVKPKKEVELIPYVMGNIETYEKEDGNPFEDGTDLGFNAGLDGKIAVTNDLTLNFTINPDFGQVEADPSEVNLSAFETYFEEKRPFFIEGSNIFDFPLSEGGGHFGRDNLFYSRRIGRLPQYDPEIEDDEFMKYPEFTRILGALKLSGKTRNGWSVGVLESLTNKEEALISNDGKQFSETVEPLTNYFNARVQKDIDKGNTVVGGMVTSTNRFINDSALNFLPTSAYTQGIDFKKFWQDKTYFFSLKTVFSEVYGSQEAITDLQEAPQRYFQRPDVTHIELDTTRTSLLGNGGTIEGGKVSSGHWRYGAKLTWRSPGLALNDMGFLSLGDYFNSQLWGTYTIWEPFSVFRNFNVNASSWSGWDFSGRFLYTGINLHVSMQFKNYWRFNMGTNRGFFDIDRHQLRGGPSVRAPGNTRFNFNISSDDRKKFIVELSMHNNWGDDTYQRSIGTGLELEYRPFNFLHLSVEPEYNDSDQQVLYIETFDIDEGNRYVVSSIHQEIVSLNFRINLSITPDLSIQYWGQPFIFSGDYSEFKSVVNPMADNWRDQYHQFTESEISYDATDNVYNIDENNDGITDYSFENPDFSFYEFRSNLVLRWEYIPGSTAYFVWSQGFNGDTPDGRFSLSENVNNLLNEPPRNVFLLKLSYRFSF